MPPVLVDERRLAAGIDDALAALVAVAPCEPLSPARFLARLLDVRVLEDHERRAIVRRVAATRPVGIAPHVRRAPAFAQRVIDAIDAGAVGPPHEALVDELRTLLSFANTLDVPSAFARAATAPRAAQHGLTTLAVDDALVRGDTFGWRRLAGATGIALEPLALAPPAPPVLDRAAVAGTIAVLRCVESGADADARRVLVAPFAGLDPDDARALLVAAGERVDVLDLVQQWTAGLHAAARDRALAAAAGLRAVAAAYRVPDAGASTVVAEILARFPVDAATGAALERVARAFDAARAFAPAWQSGDLIDEIVAELGAATARLEVPAAQPAAARTREAAAPVRVKLRPWSASSLGAYADCARKWYFRYVCAAVEDAGSSASFYGTAFHAALEAFHERYRRVDGVPEAELRSALDACVGEAFERHRTRFDAPVEYELQRRRARRTARRYVSWIVARARTAPFEVIGNEVATDVEIGGQRFVGFIDRLDRDDRTGTVSVIDYKTGSIATTAGEYLADVLAFKEFQLPFYYWARTAAGDRVSRLALVPLKDAILDVAPIELEIVAGNRAARGEGPKGAISVGELERARDRMVAIASELAAGGVTDYAVTSDPEACRYCAYADACRDRPVVLEERFGR